MVREDRITLSKFALHQTDRDPFTLAYSGDRILIELHGKIMDLDISSFDASNKIVRTQDHSGMVWNFALENDGKSDKQLFYTSIVQPWNEIKDRFAEDDDRSDFYPAFYASLEDLTKEKLRILPSDEAISQFCMEMCSEMYGVEVTELTLATFLER
jgi:hypothetical protein